MKLSMVQLAQRIEGMPSTFVRDSDVSRLELEHPLVRIELADGASYLVSDWVYVRVAPALPQEQPEPQQEPAAPAFVPTKRRGKR